MLLSDLIAPVRQIKIPGQGVPPLEITGIQFDSRKVEKGNLFVALEGGSFDGHAFIRNALDKGAVAVVGRKPLDLGSVPYFQVDDPRETLAYVSASFYGFPSHHLTMIGVTGTDGKTTTVNLIYHILLACGIKTGMISTVNAVIGEEVIDTGFHVTTPAAPTVQMLLRRMVDSGITHVVLETTSHGLAQHRADACDFDIGVITNITHEHLDYHGDYSGYLHAKARLLTGLIDTPEKDGRSHRLAVLNRDDISYPHLQAILSAPQYESIRRITYGLGEEANVRAQHVEITPRGLAFEVELDGKSWRIEKDLLGEYNVQNILAALTATSRGLGLDMPCIIRGIKNMPGVPGRMQRIDLGQDFTAIVDFAHTPNALKVALETVNRIKKDGRVIAVFGSAGLRDRQKRRMMAATSIGLADITILTAEDPRTESLDDILEEMADEARRTGGVEGQTFFRVPDRGEAIREAVGMAGKGDIVIACGKGHEQSMCFGEIEYAWDDRTAMQAVLSEHLNIPGPYMPYLPTQNKNQP